jgi:hypothetical protein
VAGLLRLLTAAFGCESAFNLDPWRNRCSQLQLNDFRDKRGGPSWTPIEHARNKKFRLCFNDMMLNWGGVQVGRRFTNDVGQKKSPGHKGPGQAEETMSSEDERIIREVLDRQLLRARHDRERIDLNSRGAGLHLGV